MMISIAKGSYDDEDATASPQLTVSMDSSTDALVGHENSPEHATAPANAPIAVDEDEHDVEESQQQQQQQPRELGAPLSSGTLIRIPSARSTDQVLELNDRLDLSDSSAIISSLNNRNNNSLPESSAISAADTGSSKKNRQSSSSSSSFPPFGGSASPQPHRRSSPSRSSLSKMTKKEERGVSTIIKSQQGRLQTTSNTSLHRETHHHGPPPLRRVEFLMYLYSFAILGCCTRIFVGRLFGGDCENTGVQDFLSPISEKICVTSTGMTIQHGGALFTDLPANMFGSFIMGILSSLNPDGGRDGSKLPWLRKEHPLQRHDGIHSAIKVGLCGSLTTFSSWNSQMVSMIDGTATELGPQVISALFGYVIGMACAAWSFCCGGRVHEWLYDWSNRISRNVGNNHAEDKPPSLPSIRDSVVDDEEQPPTSWDSEDSSPRIGRSSSEGSSQSVVVVEIEDVSRPAAHPTVLSRRLSTSSVVSMKEHLPGRTSIITCLHKIVPFCISLGLLLAYGLTVHDNNLQFYRELCACSFLTPIGVHLRYKLSAMNGQGIGIGRRYDWMPWGTLTCNLSAAVISIVFQALYMIYLKNSNGADSSNPYVLALIAGVKVGLAGSLSTVSSFAREVVNLATVHPTHAKSYIYSTLTIAASMLVGLAIYSPMMRFGYSLQ